MRRSRPVSRRNERSRREPCAGFSLPETLVAALLFAVSLVGLLQYHQVLQQSLLHQMQQRQAWRLAHQQLETEGADSVSSSSRSVPAGWRVSREEQRHPPACRRVTVTVVTPYRYRAVLGRWFCDTPDAVVQRDSP
ncbi:MULTISPECIES: prepilin-type N-terminal cleavage/methylation domain-containing protein [Dickeya]|nr:MULTISPECIES: prepilin-type N-terminal cleavage/methylation domain-containing protein [Dickeya]MBO8134098.1 potassium:proton antiporter [Dickeya fangzhongdai]UGA51941.1 potassium:proton antiporter [Dickeya fangzhongdai]ULR32117.1 potassium:proton antiporter [Dickeya fangzhongdai]UMB77790.1 potassium:proton antiporter [Dickeya fangzhongdai]UWH08286.1 potassium:proton antiporter [Dickeya fangzhongdai]